MQINVNSFVITSRSRYGYVVSILKEDDVDPLMLVRIGKSEHPIFRSQLRLVEDTVTLKVEYTTEYMGRSISDTTEVVLDKGTVVFDDNTRLVGVVETNLEKKLGMNCKVNKIFIS